MDNDKIVMRCGLAYYLPSMKEIIFNFIFSNLIERFVVKEIFKRDKLPYSLEFIFFFYVLIRESENFENSTQEKGSLGNEIPESKNLEMEFWKTEVLAMR